jgi:hypothetical protein
MIDRINTATVGSCRTCNRLWQQLRDLTMRHIALEGKLKVLLLRRDTEAIASLTPRVNSAGADRTRARTALTAHQETEHLACPIAVTEASHLAT